MRRTLLRLAGAILAAPLALVAVYCGLSVLGALLILPPGDEPRTRHIAVFATPIHADIILPIADEFADWRPLVRSPAFAGSQGERDLNSDTVSHVAIGWGAESFYFNVLQLSDIRVRHAADAVWDTGVMHVTLWQDPATVEGVHWVSMSERGYVRLIERLQAAFVRHDGEAVPFLGRNYGPWDGFFKAVPDYSLMRTCNSWLGELLRDAGVPVGIWTPFSGLLVLSLQWGDWLFADQRASALDLDQPTDRSLVAMGAS